MNKNTDQMKKWRGKVGKEYTKRNVATLREINKNHNDEFGVTKIEISLRRVKNKDKNDLWRWRNHPEVRKWCLNKQKIKYQNHKKWFEKKINDKNIIMYIVENEKKEKIGQVRLEKSKEKSFNINLNLNPSFFGKGYGNIIIKKVTKLLIRDNLEVREIIAEILDKNVVSQKAFEKAGYFFSHKILKNKQTLSIFKFEI